MGYKYIAFVGSYSQPGQADPFESSHGGIPHDRSRVGKGVLAIGVDAEGKLSYLNNGDPVIRADDLPNPSYLSFNGRSGEAARLCVVSELVDGRWQEFSVEFEEHNGEDVKLEPTDDLVDTEGSYPCHIIHASPLLGTDLIFISNYGEDQGVFSIFSNNNLNHKVLFGDGSRANFTRQQTSHAHSSCISPAMISSDVLGVCVADLGSDSIIQLGLTPNNLECVEIGRLAAPAGSGPRSRE